MKKYSEPSSLSTSPVAAAHLGEAVVQLRRLANNQISGALTRQLHEVADGLQAWMRPLERLERVCGGEQ
jgi:hypothetical protein